MWAFIVCMSSRPFRSNGRRTHTLYTALRLVAMSSTERRKKLRRTWPFLECERGARLSLFSLVGEAERGEAEINKHEVSSPVLYKVRAAKANPPRLVETARKTLAAGEKHGGIWESTSRPHLLSDFQRIRQPCTTRGSARTARAPCQRQAASPSTKAAPAYRCRKRRGDMSARPNS